MPTTTITRETPVVRSSRVLQLEGMFDLPPAQHSRTTWQVHLPLEDRPWNIGLVVGPSGSGKTTLARELFPDHLVTGYPWPTDRSLVDAFPEHLGIKDITRLLGSVGFSSPPNWLRPFHTLSNGEQFRATLARALAEQPDLAVIDEFTSVVDRTVARIGSAAVARCLRQSQRKLVAVSCHSDIIEWLQPDWIYQPATDNFQWRSLQRRPAITLRVERVSRTAWRLFRPHHYLSGDLSPAARCFVAFVEEQPAAFSAVLHFPHPRRSAWREHRTVCLPDYQGVGIGNALSEFVASLFAATGKPYRSTTGSPAMIQHRLRSTNWRLVRAPGMTRQNHRGMRTRGIEMKSSFGRITAGFEYSGPARPEEARRFGVLGTNTSRSERR